MGRAKSIGVPPLAGIGSYEDAQRPGYGVEENVELLKRYNYVETRLVQLSAAYISPTPEWEVKCGLSLHLWLDAEHSAAFRARVAEMREPPLHLDRCPDERLAALMDELLRPGSTIELLAGVYGVLRPALAAAYRQHMAETNPLMDHPTVRLLRLALLEEEDMIAWGQAALNGLAETAEAREQIEAWQVHLGRYLAAAGGIMGNEPAAQEALPAPRATRPFEPDLVPQRDARFEDIHNFGAFVDKVWMDPTRSAHERTWALMFKRLREMDVPEWLAPIIVQTPGKPWEYYQELARQTWDEARHAMMGEVGFTAHDQDWTAIPVPITGSYNQNVFMSPLERHAVLYAIEQHLMRRDTGKAAEFAVAQAAGEELAARFQDYDWADEVLHAQIGRRWLVPEIGGVPKILEMVEAARAKLGADHIPWDSPSYHNWWPEFYARVCAEAGVSAAVHSTEPNEPS